MTSALYIFLLQNTVGTKNVTLSRIALCYYRDSVTVILTAPYLQTVRYDRCCHGRDCHVESPAGRVQCFKNKLTQFQLFTPLFD